MASFFVAAIFDLSDVVRPSFVELEANPHDLKSREGARGVQFLTGDARLVHNSRGARVRRAREAMTVD